MPKGTVSAYEFLVRFQDGVESWERIQGSGGQIGNSCLYIQPNECLNKTLLKRAQNQAKREGGLRIWRNALSYKDTIKFHAGAEVLDIVAVFPEDKLQKDRSIQKIPVKDPSPVEPFVFPYRGGKVVVQTMVGHIAMGYTEGTDREVGDGPFQAPMRIVKKWMVQDIRDKLKKGA